jgi:hypothetical protein
MLPHCSHSSQENSSTLSKFLKIVTNILKNPSLNMFFQQVLAAATHLLLFIYLFFEFIVNLIDF